MDQVRAIVRREARNVSPPVELWRVVKRKPLTIEHLGSDRRAVDGDDDFLVARQVRIHARPGDECEVRRTADGDLILSTIIHPYGKPEMADGFAPKKVPKGGRATLPENSQVMIGKPPHVEEGGTLELDGDMVEGN